VCCCCGGRERIFEDVEESRIRGDTYHIFVVEKGLLHFFEK